MGVKYQLTNSLFMHSERRLDQTCAGFSDHCISGTTCDPDTNLCTTVTTEYSKCCLYAIPGVLHVHPIPLSLSDSVSLTSASFCLYLFTCPYLFWQFVQLLQPLPSPDVHLFPAHVVVYRGSRSQGPLC